MVSGRLFVPTKGQLRCAFNFWCLGLSGVGRVSVLTLTIKNSCQTGRLCKILFHTWLESETSRILFWTVSLVSCHAFRLAFL